MIVIPSALFFTSFVGWQVEGRAAKLDDQQREIQMDVDLPSAGRYVMLVVYVSSGQGRRSYVNMHIQTAREERQGRAVLYDCTLASSCRQVVTDPLGQIVFFDFQSPQAHITLRAQESSDGNFDRH